MGRCVDVDCVSENDLDTAVFAIDWLVGMALLQACNDEREVATESACMRSDDCSGRIGGRCC